MRVHIKGKEYLQGVTLLDPSTKTPRCNRFSRIPYALPPNGKRRWRKPEPLPALFSYGSSESSGRYTGPSTPCPQIGVLSANEDCLYLNIWVPLGSPPQGGWPVFFYLHGGFLQFGSNNSDDPSALLGETAVKCVIVSPGYRLGIFGFLASKELWKDSTAANFGFWDQRMALEWTYENIEAFGGNKENITIAGLSAGAYSAFHQLAYDIGPVSNRQIIRRICQWSNGCGVQPKQIFEAQETFDDLLSILDIQSNDDAQHCLDLLREKSPGELLDAVAELKHKFIRPILDGDFISEQLFPNIYNGELGRRMKALNIQIMIGDLTQEYHLYKGVFPPNSHSELIERLSWDYPRSIATAISAPYKPASYPDTRTPEEWSDIFGRLYADMQIHSTMRGLVDSLSKSMPVSSIYRYRIDWRTVSVDKRFPPELGATHGTDMSIWFFGNGDTLTRNEKEIIKEWLEPVAAFIEGKEVDWGTDSISQVRYLTDKGVVEVREDEVWDQKLLLWQMTKKATVSKPNI